MSGSYITADGLNKLKAELQQLEGVERPRVIKAIAEARDKGDLSENAEYSAAKEEQAQLESKIQALKTRIVEAKVLNEKDIDTSEVQLLTKVRVRNKKNGLEKEYQIVTDGEADISQGKLSITTPIAKGLLGKKVGEVASINVPAGLMELEVLSISI